jgi:hypothetical protein
MTTKSDERLWDGETLEQKRYRLHQAGQEAGLGYCANPNCTRALVNARKIASFTSGHPPPSCSATAE